MTFEPNEQYDNILDTFYQEMNPVYVNYPKQNKLSNSAIYETIKKWKPADKTPFLKYLVQVIDSKHKQKDKYTASEITFVYQLLMTSLFKSTLGFTESSLKELLTLLNESRKVNMHLGEWPITHAVNQIDKFIKKNGLSEDLKSFLEKMITWEDLSGVIGFKNGSLSKSREKLDAILFEHSGSSVVAPEFKLLTYDKIGAVINKKINALGVEKAQYWHQLFDLASKNAESAKPTKKYLNESTAIIQNIGTEIYYPYVKQFFDHVTGMKNTVDKSDPDDSLLFITHFNSLIIKGLIWTMIGYDNSEILDTLAALAERCFKKDPGPKAASINIGNACIHVIKTHAEE